MIKHLPVRSVLAVVFGLALSVFAQSRPEQPANPQVAGEARFTVLSPNCIRMEYGKVTDEPTLFAIKRSGFPADFKLGKEEGGGIGIETAAMKLHYQPDGKPFHAGNLKVEIRRGEAWEPWTPGMKNKANLGGPLATLDGIGGPVPLPEGLLARDGWHLIDDGGKPILVNGWIASRPADRGIDWYLFGYGDDYPAALRSLAVVAGPCPIPRKHVFGSWYCRWKDYTEQDFRDLVSGYREHDFPLDIMVMDMGWHTIREAKTGIGHAGMLGWTGWTWNRKLLPNAEKLLADFRQDGIKVTLNAHPHDGVRAHEQCYPEFMKQLGLDPAKDPVPKFDAGSKAYMEAYFKTAHWPTEDAGVDFWWVDWQQDGKPGLAWVPGVPGLRHLPWLNELYYQNSRRGGDKRGLGFSRWGGWGDHRNPIQFSGDTSANWGMLRFEIEFTERSGNSGCFFWAHDLGGFSGGGDPELFARWVQFGALSSSLRVHGTSERRPWCFGPKVERSARIAYDLRSQLMPYLYSSVRQCNATMLPLIRPLYLAYPREEAAYTSLQEYLFGDNLLVAPVTQPGKGPENVAEQTLWLPPGTSWYHWFTNERLAGPGKIELKSTLDEFPLLARAGMPIPLQPVSPRMTSTQLNTLIVRCWPGEEGKTGSSTLYEDDGQTEAYLKGGFAETQLAYARAGNQITVTVEPATGTYQGQPARRSVTLELAATQTARSAKVNGQPAKIEYDAASFTNRIILPDGDIRQRQVVVVEVADADQAAISAAVAEKRRILRPPVATPPGPVAPVSEKTEMTLATDEPGATIRYTLDGSAPTVKSPAYAAPLRPTALTVVKAAIFTDKHPEGSDPVEVFFVDAARGGLNCQYYEGSWKKLPDFTALTPKATVRAWRLNLDAAKHPADHFGFRFTGFIRIDQDGDYTFFITSDDGSRLSIDGATLVDNDGAHPAETKSGKVKLAAGLHPVEILYFDDIYSEELKLEWQGPGFKREAFPDSRFQIESKK